MSIQSHYVLFVDRQPTNEISDNQLVQFNRMVGTVYHSIDCSEAVEMLTHSLWNNYRKGYCYAWYVIIQLQWMMHNTESHLDLTDPLLALNSLSVQLTVGKGKYVNLTANR
jgi:hypothetical protein